MVDLMADVVRERPRVGHPRTRCRRCWRARCRSSASARRRRPTAARTSRRCLRLAKDLGRVDAATRRAPHVFVFRSTLVPGTVEDVLRPIIEDESGKKDGERLPRLLPARVPARGLVDHATTTSRRSRSSAPIARTPVARAARSCSATCPCEFLTTSVRAAEMVKYCCNNFHALKITFANETARLCEAMGVDPFEVMDLRLPGPPAQHLAGLPEAGIRVRRIVPAQGPARHDLPGQEARRRDADARGHPAVEPRARRTCRREGAGHGQAARSA